MSIRINLSLFDSDELLSVFGSSDQAVIQTIDEKLLYLEDLGDLEPRDYRTARKTLIQAINVGVPIDGVKNESYGHVELANLLADYEQAHEGLDCDFKYFGVEAFWEEFRGVAQEPGRSLFDVFLKGRPLFGKKISQKLEVRYGYLTNKEVHAVATCLQLLAQEYPANQDVSEIAGGYLECLRHVCSGKRDIWVEVG